jgi:uncharacterized protein
MHGVERTTHSPPADGPRMYDGVPFEWDPAKARSNEAKHGVSFELATGVFGDPLAIERWDDREDYDEQRYILIGMAYGTLLFVVYTQRNCVSRLISARQATRREQDDYFQQNT